MTWYWTRVILSMPVALIAGLLEHLTFWIAPVYPITGRLIVTRFGFFVYVNSQQIGDGPFHDLDEAETVLRFHQAKAISSIREGGAAVERTRSESTPNPGEANT